MILRDTQDHGESSQIMTILGIETSCDETSAAILTRENTTQTPRLLSNVVASSLSLHAKTGGIIPETAAREQLNYILPVITEALEKGLGKKYIDQKEIPPIDAIAVTYGPGLIGSLLVGVETAKTLSYIWNKPLIPVNHLIGHIYANWIAESKAQRAESKNLPYALRSKLSAGIKFPALALIVSGGHTDLVLMKSHGKLQLIGGTRDDAAGEAFDKIGRLLGLPYPAGPIIEQKAKQGDPKRFQFPRPLIGSDDFDFSFSGLKTAVLREVQALSRHSERSEESLFRHAELDSASKLDEQTVCDISRGVLDAIVSVLVRKTLKAAKYYSVKSILLSGGVAANQTLVNEMKLSTFRTLPSAAVFAPQKQLCTDNGAMIAAAAFYNNKQVSWNELTANPELYF